MTTADTRYRAGRSVADALRDHGIDSAVKLSANELPYGPLPAVVDAVVAGLTGPTGLNRYPDYGAGALRAAVAAHHGVDAAQVALGSGSSSLIGQLARAVAGPGTEVVAADPGFDLYRIAAVLAGAEPVSVPVVDGRVDPGRLAAAVGPRTRLVFLASPHNPTSTAVAEHELRDLLTRVPDGCVVALDEAYVQFADAAYGIRATQLLAEFPGLVVLRTFSKAHGLAALRVGYLLGAPEVVTAVERLASPFHVNALAQRAAVTALQVPDQLAERVARVVAERERVSAALRADGWSHPASRANFVWLPAGAGSAWLAHELERSGIVTRPIGVAGVRVTIGAPAENDRFLAAFGQLPAARLRADWTAPAGEAGRRLAALHARAGATVRAAADPAALAGVVAAAADRHSPVPPELPAAAAADLAADLVAGLPAGRVAVVEHVLLGDAA